jgi:ABC-2 type transport system ATP-binding protein
MRLDGVRKSYGMFGRRKPVLQGLDLAVPEGGVHGLLGPNGSGKTTSLRIALGLTAADAGAVTVLGRAVPRDLPLVMAQVGALVERPRLVPQWSGRFNLRVLAQVAGVSNGRVEECLEQVGMTERAEVAFKVCSLGMKQRLGIAAALLKSPRLLILDEPGNGLDPAGIHEVRQLMMSIAATGDTTVIVSSHQLSEVEQMCDRLYIVSAGQLVAAGTVAEIAGQRSNPDLLVHVNDAAAACELLRSAGFDADVHAGNVLVRAPQDASAVTFTLTTAGQRVAAVIPQASSLEERFLALTTKAKL